MSDTPSISPEERRRIMSVNTRLRDLEDKLEAKQSDDRIKDATLITLGYLAMHGEVVAAAMLGDALRSIEELLVEAAPREFKATCVLCGEEKGKCRGHMKQGGE